MTIPPPRPDDRGPGPSRSVDWDAEEEAAEARRGPGAGRARRRWWWIGGTAVVGMTAVAVWFGLAATVGRVSWVDTGHDIVSAELVEVRFDVRRDPSRAVVCELEAQDLTRTVVGRARVDVGPTGSSPSRHVAPVRTAAPAVTAYVERCWYADEAPPGER